MIRASLTGRRYGMLVVQGVESQGAWGELRYFCRCDCGVQTVVWAGNLRTGRATSCGSHRAHQELLERQLARYPAISRARPIA